MNAIQLENFRCLKNTGDIPIVPITVLVGENSSGKSSFLRLFPLLKQSILNKTNGPILWSGDIDDYVDFGSFEETITDDDSKHIGVGFSFVFDIMSYVHRYYRYEIVGLSTELLIKYSIRIEKKKDYENVSELNIKLNDTQITYKISKAGNTRVFVDGHRVDLEANNSVTDDSESILLWGAPFEHSCLGIEIPENTRLLFDSIEEKCGLERDPENNELNRSSFFVIGRLLIDGTPIEQVADIVRTNKPRSNRSLSQRRYERIKNHVDVISNCILCLEDGNREHIIELLKLFFLNSIYYGIDNYIGEYFSQVHYIAPIRATAERYYRLRNSAIDEVDYQGKNLAIFLNSLPVKRLSSFQKWTADTFGFKASVVKTEGHLSIVISRPGYEKSINMSDTGFGYSQILPIITQLWELSSRRNNLHNSKSSPWVVAIEQPELHLHPALQAKLAKAFIACVELAKSNGNDIQLILETHSETIVNSFGRAIARGTLSAHDINVILFDKNDETNNTITSISSYDDDGFLNNWPIGFFAPED